MKMQTQEGDPGSPPQTDNPFHYEDSFYEGGDSPKLDSSVVMDPNNNQGQMNQVEPGI